MSSVGVFLLMFKKHISGGNHIHHSSSHTQMRSGFRTILLPTDYGFHYINGVRLKCVICELGALETLLDKIKSDLKSNSRLKCANLMKLLLNLAP